MRIYATGHYKGSSETFEQMIGGFGWGVMLGVVVMLVANAPVTLSPVLLSGVGGSFWQGLKRVTR